jgi:hypothetical protein
MGATNLLTSAEAENLVDTDFMRERKMDARRIAPAGTFRAVN